LSQLEEEAHEADDSEMKSGKSRAGSRVAKRARRMNVSFSKPESNVFNKQHRRPLS
jgi:hypothetical protein